MSRASGHPAAAVALIGAGAWGTALAVHLARRGGRARLWARDPALAAEMRETGQNARYLPGLAIPPGVEVISEPATALAGAGIVIVAVPSEFVRAVVGTLAHAVPPGAIIVSATKGLEPEQGG
ncbi:MAG: NAD(P)-binding domain-containing protein, partial [Candidatus Rokubacteria bacterium]|nr:NAD(P)-binding domain-containing protein [Candidatus Rokubacteria bacterium]